MELLLKILVIIITPFAYAYSYLKEYFNSGHNLTSKELSEVNFKPFWIETNQIFQEVLTKEEFLRINLKFEEAYVLKNKSSFGSILDLKISKYDFDLNTMSPRNKDGLISFGLRSEHIHDINYTLRDYFNS